MLGTRTTWNIGVRPQVHIRRSHRVSGLPRDLDQQSQHGCPQIPLWSRHVRSNSVASAEVVIYDELLSVLVVTSAASSRVLRSVPEQSSRVGL